MAIFNAVQNESLKRMFLSNYYVNLAWKWDQNISSKKIKLLVRCSFMHFSLLWKTLKLDENIERNFARSCCQTKSFRCIFQLYLKRPFLFFVIEFFSFFPILIKTHKTNLEIGRQQRDRRHHFSMPHQITFLCLFGGMRHMMHKM